jgi:hypothetical protein
MSSDADNNVVESCWLRYCRGDFVVARYRRRVMPRTMLTSPTSDGRYRGDLAATRCRCRVMLVTMVLSHAGDGAAEFTCSLRDVDVKSC